MVWEIYSNHTMICICIASKQIQEWFFFPVCFEPRCFCSNFSASKALELLLQGNGSTTNTDFHFEHSQKTTHSLMTCMRNLPILTSSSRVYCNEGRMCEWEGTLWVGMQRLNHAPTLEQSEMYYRNLRTSIYLDLKRKIISIIIKCIIAKKNHRSLKEQISSTSAHHKPHESLFLSEKAKIFKRIQV